MAAGNILNTLKAREASIQLDFHILSSPPEFRDRMRAGGFCPPVMVVEPETARLRDLALEGVRVEDVFRRVLLEQSRPKLETDSIENVITGYHTYLLKILKNSAKFAGVKISDIRKAIAHAKVSSVADLTRKLFEAWIASLGNKGQTVNKKIGYVSGFLEWCVANKYAVENVARDVGSSTTDPVDDSVYSKAELEAIFRRVRGKTYEKVIHLAFWTGLDKGDLSKLTGEEVDYETRMIIGRRSKTGKIREEVPIFDQVLSIFNTLPRKGRVFGQWKNLNSIAKKANKLGIDFRKLRRSYVSHLTVGNGVSIPVVSRWAVHDPKTEAKSYARPTGEPVIFTWHGRRLKSWGLPEVGKAEAL